MRDFNEQYQTERNSQERKANIRTIKGFAWLLGGMALVWVLTMVGFFIIGREPVNLAFALSLVLFVVPGVIACGGSLEAPWVKYVLLGTLCIIVGILTAILTQHATLLYVMPLIIAIQYRDRPTLWFTFLMSCLTMVVSCLVGFYYGICDTNIFIKGNHNYEWYSAHYSGGLLEVPLNENPTFIILAYEVLPRVIILFVYTMILYYLVISSSEEVHRIANLTYGNDTDMRTRLYSRNKYEEMVGHYYPTVEHVAVLFWDLNHLKQTNDVYGHAEGDSLIERMARVLYERMNDRCKAYHIGGDEFILVIENPEEGEAAALAEEVRVALTQVRTASGLTVSSAVGYAEGPGEEISEVERWADHQMYRNKAECRDRK